ncbi:MAG TPA: type VI secretion protein IcmF/TssM N-terminal domain-containing protein, partial [Pirellulales bacterium]|nr:type VI secretion protein IcmF/TssM N-terminal domain-containing protein [Pirellulales bacterium]
MGVALIVALFLLVLFAVALLLTVYATEPGWLLPWWQALPFVILLLVLIPIVTYYAVAIWLEEDVSEFEDIDRAWQAGLQALEKNGIDIASTPIFLLFGSQGDRHEQNVLRAARLRLTVTGAPNGSKHALHWYANDEAIYLSLTNVGQLSALSAAAARTADELASKQYEGRGEMNPMEAVSARHTVDLSEMMPAASPQAAVAAKIAEPDRMDDLRGTMLVADLLKTQWIPGEESSSKSRQPTVILSAEEADRQRRRIQHLCRLLRRGRMPLCPVNGALALLPSDLMTFNDDDAKLVSSAFAADVKAMIDKLMLRFPLGVLVVNLETETGFNELVRRLGREAALHRRFGKGYDLWGKLTPQYLDQLCDCACGAFEGFIYNLYSQKGAVESPGNRPLYSLLCHIRVHVQPKLARV